MSSCKHVFFFAPKIVNFLIGSPQLKFCPTEKVIDILKIAVCCPNIYSLITANVGTQDLIPISYCVLTHITHVLIKMQIKATPIWLCEQKTSPHPSWIIALKQRQVYPLHKLK